MQKYISYKNGYSSFDISCTGSPKKLQIHFVLFLEMTGRVFLIELSVFGTSLTLFNKVEKHLCIQFVSLSVCACSNSRKYSSNVFNFKHVVHV